MKNLFIVFVLSIAFVSMASAQEYKALKVGFGWGFAGTASGGHRYSYGSLNTFEPAYRLNDEVAIGLRYEGARLTDNTFSYKVINSVTGNVQYYLGDTKLRPFIGGGAGWFLVNTGYFESVNHNLGFYPRVGFDSGHFNVTVDYNFIVRSNGTVYEITDNYLDIRLGVFLWGGKKV